MTDLFDAKKTNSSPSIFAEGISLFLKYGLTSLATSALVLIALFGNNPELGVTLSQNPLLLEVTSLSLLGLSFIYSTYKTLKELHNKPILAPIKKEGLASNTLKQQEHSLELDRAEDIKQSYNQNDNDNSNDNLKP